MCNLARLVDRPLVRPDASSRSSHVHIAGRLGGHHNNRHLETTAMPKTNKARAVGLNHIALEGGEIEEALAFYGRLFEFTLRGKSENAAFIDLGDQFLALQ